MIIKIGFILLFLAIPFVDYYEKKRHNRNLRERLDREEKAATAKFKDGNVEDACEYLAERSIKG